MLRVGRIQLTLLMGLLCACLTGAVVASEAYGACPNEALRTGPSASLPDCRAFEQVTPINKSVAVQDLDTTNMQAISAVDGERIAVKSLVALGTTPLSNGSLSVFSRTGSDWQIESVPPPSVGSSFYVYPIFSPRLTQVGSTVESTDETPLGQTLQIGEAGNPPYVSIAATPSTQTGENYMAGATPDFSRVFFESTDHTLLSTTPTGSVAGAHDLYEWSGGGECGAATASCELVNVHSDGSLVGECGARLQSASEDGSKVVFQSPDPEATSSSPSCKQPFGLYMRITETIEGHTVATTEEISKPNEGVVEHTGLHPVYFACASANGSKIFFITAAELTTSDEGVPGPQLYEYDASAKRGERLMRISNNATGPMELEGETSKGYVENVFTSRDGSETYFLVGGKIYRYNTVSRDLRLIAETEGTGTGSSGASRYNEITPDGNFFTFVTLRLIGFPIADPEKYDEVYRYDDETESIVCVSCLPGGAQPTGDSLFHTQAGILETNDRTPQFTAISEDGSYIFFESTQSLVPQAVNVHGGSFERNNTDVYEWHNGVISLISSPIDQHPQRLLGASADGSNVFFLTHAQLVPQDIDTSADIYDARIGGGFPSSTPSAACLGDTCQSAPVVPVEPTLATSVLGVSGNLAPPIQLLKAHPRKTQPGKAKKKCGRGRTRRNGRCVKARSGRSSHRAFAHNRGGSR